jgi:hypothetical protein
VVDVDGEGLSGDEGGIFYRAARKCRKCGATVYYATRVKFGAGAVTEYCECGGILDRVTKVVTEECRSSTGSLSTSGLSNPTFR